MDNRSRIDNAPSALRIVHVVSSLQYGGMEKFVLRIAAAQRADCHDARVLALRGGPLSVEAAAMGVPVTVLTASGAAGRIAQTAGFFSRFRPQITHSHNTTSLHYAVFGKLTAGSRVVITCHGQGGGRGRRPSALERLCKDAEVACSKHVAQESAEFLYAKNLHVIPNGVEFSPAVRTREETRRELGIAPYAVVAVMVARIDGMKGHDTLLRALACMGDTAPVMLLAGDGGKREEMKTLARELGLAENRVRFLGFRQDVPDLLDAADLFVLPSLTEGMPLSVLEAMSHGLPVAATAVGGIPELVTEGVDGFLVPPKEPEALAAAMARLTADAKLRSCMGEAGRERVRRDFSFDRMTAAYEALYRELLSGSSGGPHIHE